MKPAFPDYQYLEGKEIRIYCFPVPCNCVSVQSDIKIIVFTTAFFAARVYDVSL